MTRDADPKNDKTFETWRSSTAMVSDVLCTMSGQVDANELVNRYVSQMAPALRFDRSVSVSRRGLAYPTFRVTRHSEVQTRVDPWKYPEKLSTLSGGLLAELLYAGQVEMLDELAVAANDPARQLLRGMGSLLALPHYDDRQVLNMVFHLRAEPYGFDPQQIPTIALISGLFGQAVKNLVLKNELSQARDQLQHHLETLNGLTTTVMEQAVQLKDDNTDLEQRVTQRTRELYESHCEAIYMLAVASEAKDLDTGRHVKRIEKLAESLALQVGYSPAQASELGLSAILHDVGKMHVPDEILKKPGPLTPSEWEIMRWHTLAGERIIVETPFFAQARTIARSHHENWDGSGYPDSLVGEKTPVSARIVHLVDVFDALTSHRVYKPAWPVSRAICEIQNSSGTMFEPSLVDQFCRMAFAHEI